MIGELEPFPGAADRGQTPSMQGGPIDGFRHPALVELRQELHMRLPLLPAGFLEFGRETCLDTFRPCPEFQAFTFLVVVGIDVRQDRERILQSRLEVVWIDRGAFSEVLRFQCAFEHPSLPLCLMRTVAKLTILRNMVVSRCSETRSD